MIYYWRVFLWENGHKSTEYTDYTVAPIFIEDKLDETLDSGEVVLKAMPIATRDAFPPKTKFRLERYTTEDYTDEPKKWDFIVEHDDVEEYVGCPEICTHRINLIEASAIAQGMHPDNIALTYELQDVDLNYRVLTPDNTIINDNFYKTDGSSKNLVYDRSLSSRAVPSGELAGTSIGEGNYKNAYKYEWLSSSFEGQQGIKNLKVNYHALNQKTITFNIPKLFAYGSKNSGEWTSALFQVNTVTRVYKVLRRNGSIMSRAAIMLNGTSTAIKSGAKSFTARDDDLVVCDGSNVWLRKIKDWAYHSYGEQTDSHNEHHFTTINGGSGWDTGYEKFPLAAQADSNFPDSITFTSGVLSQSQLDNGYTIDYEIDCRADDAYQNGYISRYEHYYHWEQDHVLMILVMLFSGNDESTIKVLEKESANNMAVSATLHFIDESVGANVPFLKKGVKYSCYDLFRKALLTCDTHIVTNGSVSLDEYGAGDQKQASIEYSIIVDPLWESRLKTARVHETVFEQKNLWEILLQIGYYLHAIPYLEFADDGTERFVLKFQQLGATQVKNDDSVKITIFNSRNLSEYFTQYDSYLTNLFSPQNVIEEYLAPKTTDTTYLVSNNTAELQTKYPINEIVEFDIIYNGERKSALSYIFEKSIYEILTGEDPEQIFPAKGNTLYYTLGDNKIGGLSYVAKSANNDKLMALKYIMSHLFGISASSWSQYFTFNNLRFRIKYRTQDSLRLTQFRPDLENFMKNSSYENYPHHEQFYGQQDKIIDSERFSANLWGKLIRVGNGVYQRQEYAVAGNEKESGDLVPINDETYYVANAESEHYNDAILQKVTYSKNFNQISQIVTIPSEPRFYEVSEKSKVRREIRIQEFFVLSTEDKNDDSAPVFIAAGSWRQFIISLLFKRDRTLPNYAWTRFVADRKRYHKGANDSYISYDKLFPSSEIERTGANSVSAKDSSDHADCIVPLLHYPLHDGIVFEWDMDDNFKAGDFVDSSTADASTDKDNAYMAQQSFRYVDILGRADLFRFFLFNKTAWTDSQIQLLPKAVISPPSDSPIGVWGSNDNAVALDKDNREEISFNYQINLLHHRESDGFDFYTFPNLFGDKDEDLKVALLNREQSLFDEGVDMSWATVLSYNVPYAFSTTVKGSIKITFDENGIEWINGGDLSQVKAIVFYQNNNDHGRAAFIVKNVSKNADVLAPWYIYPKFNH